MIERVAPTTPLALAKTRTGPDQNLSSENTYTTNKIKCAYWNYVQGLSYADAHYNTLCESSRSI